MRLKIALLTALLTILNLSLASESNDKIRLDAFFADDESGYISAVLSTPVGLNAKANDFWLLEDGEATKTATKIMSVKQSDWKLSLVLCIDTSRSLQGKPTKDKPIEEIRSALNRLMDGSVLRETDEIALRTFDDSTELVWWWSDPIGSGISEAIDNLAARGNWTVLHKALYAALKNINERDGIQAGSRQLRRILLISDGKNEHPDNEDRPQNEIKEIHEKERRKILELAQKLNIRIDFLARVRKDRVKEDLEEGHVKSIQDLSNDTGGFFAYAEPDQVYEKTMFMIERILAQQVVNFQRDIDTAAERTEKAGIQFGTWREELPYEIYRTSVPLPPPPVVTPDKREVPIWVIWLIVFLVILLVVYVFYRSAKQTTPVAPAKKSVDSGIGTREAKTIPPVRHTQIAPQQRVTQISPMRTTDLPESGNIEISLDCIAGPASGNHYSFSKHRIQIGSNEDNDLSVPEDEFVSGQHAILDISSDQMLITDLDTTNGTLLNESPLEPKVSAIVHAGDRIQMGETIFRIENQ